MPDEVKTDANGAIIPPITKGSALADIKETKELGLRAQAALMNLEITHVSQLAQLTKKRVMKLENTGKTTWDELEHYKFIIADMVTTNGKAEKPKAAPPKPAADPLPKGVSKDKKRLFAEVRKQAVLSGMVAFIEMVHEHDEDEEDEVAILALDPFSIVSVEQGRSTHPLIHYTSEGGFLSAKVNHPMVVVMKWIADGRKNAYNIQVIKRGDLYANNAPDESRRVHGKSRPRPAGSPNNP